MPLCYIPGVFFEMCVKPNAFDIHKVGLLSKDTLIVYNCFHIHFSCSALIFIHCKGLRIRTKCIYTFLHHCSKLCLPNIRDLGFILFFKRFYLVSERGKGRDKERERNISWLPLACPQLQTWPPTQACALTGNRTSDLRTSLQVGAQSTEPHQPGP